MNCALRIILWACCLCIGLPALATRIVLTSGRIIDGIVVQTYPEVLIVEDANGRRFQIATDEIASLQDSPTSDSVAASTTKDNAPKVSLRIALGGGGLFVPQLGKGGYGSAEIQVGSRSIGQRRIFAGGSVGYSGHFAQQGYHFLPLMAVVSVPLLEGKHAPEVGAGIGYGFALKSPDRGGMAATLDVAWRYQFKPHAALLLGLQARFQQARVRLNETINNAEYTSTLGRNFTAFGTRLVLAF